MSRTLLHRPARIWPPPVPDEPLVVPAPVVPPSDAPSGAVLQLLFPMVSGLGGLLFIMYDPKPLFIAIGALMAVGSVGLSVALYGQQRAVQRRQRDMLRRHHAARVAEIRDAARRTALAQDLAAHLVHPAPAALFGLVSAGRRVWERRIDHADFLTVRLGTGTVPLAAPLELQPMAPETADPAAEQDRRTLLAEVGLLPEQPLVLDLQRHPVLSLIGPATASRAVAAAAVTELAALCAPDDLTIVVCRERPGDAWEFAKWLPHTRPDGVPLLDDDPGAVTALLRDEVSRRRTQSRQRLLLPGAGAVQAAATRRLLVVVDGYPSADAGRAEVLADLVEDAAALQAGVLVLVDSQRAEPPRVHARLRLGNGGDLQLEVGAETLAGTPDPDEPALRLAVARTLAPLRLADDDAPVLHETCRLTRLLGASSAADLDVARRWRRLRVPDDLLRVPIGRTEDGRAAVLDLKESALGGMGPHGLVIGATGSGKSELLRTLVTGLVLNHSPEVLSLVLVDFKGGAAFAGLSGLPHVAGMITNLADDLTMVDRMHAALYGEQLRRQNLLRDAGNLDSVREYQRRRAAGRLPGADPLPYLVIVVDEFSELLSSRPDFIDLFVAIGRLGRSLGMHLLLASQRLDLGRLRGLDSHLSYRLCLRTFSAAESQAVIGTADAYELPPIPGSAYLKVDTTVHERFKAALVSGPDPAAAEQAAAPTRAPRLFGIGGPATAAAAGPTRADRGAADTPAGASDPGGGEVRTEMAVLVDRVLGTGARPAHQVWLPPLGERLPLRQVLEAPVVDPVRGLTAPTRHPGGCRVPFGVVDLPQEQRQVPYAVDFAAWAVHLAVVGAPQCGKSTLLRTLLVALIATHTPAEAQVYAIDYGGGGLFALESAPHVGAVCGRREPALVARVLAEVQRRIDEREERFRTLAIDSPEALRRHRTRHPSAPEDGGGDLADVFLVIDGWGALREDHEAAEDALLDIVSRGPRTGVHLVLTANRWLEIRPTLRDNISGRLEMRLNDPADSLVSRSAAGAMPPVPGRFLTPTGDQGQAALPDLGCSAEEFAARAAEAWPSAGAPVVRLLPRLVTADRLPEPQPDEPGVPFGIEEDGFGPAYLDLSGADAHFLVFGDAECGKTTFLRTWLRQLTARHDAKKAMFLVGDYRRTLVGCVPEDQMWSYCGAATSLAAAVRELADGIVERLPPPTLSAEALASRSWWEGPEFFVVVDDYDLVASPSGNPLLPLLDVLAQGRDLGLHVVLARRVGGMSRGGFEPVLGRLRELRTPGLLMAGDPAEGPILGPHRAVPLPPGRGLLVRRRRQPVSVQVATAVGASGVAV